MDTISVENNLTEIVIRIPKEVLVFSQSHRGDPIQVYDENSMTKDFVENFLDYGADGDSDGKFYNLLDEWFVERLEHGVDYLKGWWEDEEKD